MNPYTNPTELHNRLTIMTEFILSTNLEDEYINFLKSIQLDPQFKRYDSTILNTIEEYEITEEYILNEMSNLLSIA